MRALTATHIQGPLQIKSAVEFGRPVRLFRVDCGCGYRSMWYSEPQMAFTSHARHSNGEGVVFAERKEVAR